MNNLMRIQLIYLYLYDVYKDIYSFESIPAKLQK